MWWTTGPGGALWRQGEVRTIRIRRILSSLNEDNEGDLAAHEVGEAGGEDVVHDAEAGGVEAEGGAPHGERHRQGPRQARPTPMLGGVVVTN